MTEREQIETHIARWLCDLADHTDNEHDQELLCNLASMVENGEYRNWDAGE